MIKNCICGGVAKLEEYRHSAGWNDDITYSQVSCPKCGLQFRVDDDKMDIEEIWNRLMSTDQDIENISKKSNQEIKSLDEQWNDYAVLLENKYNEFRTEKGLPKQNRIEIVRELKGK